MERVPYFVVRVLSGLVWVDHLYCLDERQADDKAESLRMTHGYTAVVATRWRV